MVTGKFVVLILILVFGINMISAQSFADDTSPIITTSDGYTFNAATGMITGYSGNGGDIEIPSQINGVEVIGIGNSAFYRRVGLTAVTIPDGVTSIGNSAFEECRKLSAINIPNSVTRIGGHAFSVCVSLTAITIPDSVTSIEGSTFYECAGLTTVTIPDSVTSIGDDAFSFCTW